MCDGGVISIPAATLAIAAVSSYVAYDTSQKAAQQQVDYQEDMSKAANKNALQNYEALNDQQAQKQALASQQIQEQRKQEAQAEASQRVASSEAGVAGLSVDSLLGDIRRVGSNNVSAINQQLTWDISGLNSQRQQVYASAKSGQLSNSQAVSSESLAQLGINLAGATVQAGGQAYRNYKNKGTA